MNYKLAHTPMVLESKTTNLILNISAILMYVSFKLQSLQYLLKCYSRIILNSFTTGYFWHDGHMSTSQLGNDRSFLCQRRAAI